MIKLVLKFFILISVVGVLLLIFHYRSFFIKSDDGMIQGNFTELRSSIPGRIYFFKSLRPGSEVKKGEPLVRIENNQFANQEIAAQHYNLKNLSNNLSADISTLEVEFVFAEKNIQRARLLHISNSISKKELEEQQTECDRIASLIPLKKNHRKEIMNNLNEISTQLDRIKREQWRSPVDGVVWAVYAHTGEYRDKDTPLITLVDKSDLFVDAYWSEKHLNKLKTGRRVEIEVIATGDKLSGVIKSIRAGVGRVRFANPVQLPAESFKKRIVVARLGIAENANPFGAEQFYGIGVSVRARFAHKGGEPKWTTK
jgi:multidrug resistance efflux pump